MPDAKFYLGDADDPALTIPEPVVTVLDRHGYFRHLRSAASLPGYVFDDYEGDTIPHDCLARLIEASRDFAGRYRDADEDHVITRPTRFRGRGEVAPDPPAWTVNDRDLYAAALAIAEVAERANGASTDLNVSM